MLFVANDNSNLVEGDQQPNLVREAIVDLVDVKGGGDDPSDVGQNSFLRRELLRFLLRALELVVQQSVSYCPRDLIGTLLARATSRWP